MGITCGLCARGLVRDKSWPGVCNFIDTQDLVTKVDVGVWCMECGVWCMVQGVWCVAYGVWYMVCGIWCIVVV